MEVGILADAKSEFTQNLCDILTPRIYEGIRSIYEECKFNCNNKKYEHGNQTLATFQKFLSDISKWNNDVLMKEYERIKTKTDCKYLDDLLTAVFIAHTRVLSSIRNGNKKKKINLKIPKIYNFIHKCYINSAREFWKYTFLFHETNNKLDIQRNMMQANEIIEKAIKNTIRSSLPVKSILDEYLGENEETEYETRPEDEENYIQKMIVGEIEKWKDEEKYNKEQESDFTKEYKHESDFRQEEQKQEYTNNMQDNILDKIPSDIPDNVLLNVPDNVPHNIVDNVQDNFPDNIPDNVTVNVPVNYPDKVPDKVPDNVSDYNIADNIPEINKTYDITDDITNNIPQDLEKEMQEFDNLNESEQLKKLKELENLYSPKKYNGENMLFDQVLNSEHSSEKIQEGGKQSEHLLQKDNFIKQESHSEIKNIVIDPVALKAGSNKKQKEEIEKFIEKNKESINEHEEINGGEINGGENNDIKKLVENNEDIIPKQTIDNFDDFNLQSGEDSFEEL